MACDRTSLRDVVVVRLPAREQKQLTQAEGSLKYDSTAT